MAEERRVARRPCARFLVFCEGALFSFLTGLAAGGEGASVPSIAACCSMACSFVATRSRSSFISILSFIASSYLARMAFKAGSKEL